MALALTPCPDRQTKWRPLLLVAGAARLRANLTRRPHSLGVTFPAPRKQSRTASVGVCRVVGGRSLSAAVCGRVAPAPARAPQCDSVLARSIAAIASSGIAIWASSRRYSSATA